jgi:hypothetical protein
MNPTTKNPFYHAIKLLVADVTTRADSLGSSTRQFSSLADREKHEYETLRQLQEDRRAAVSLMTQGEPKAQGAL